MNALRMLLAEDSCLIPYRKSLRKIAGSVTATILLQQIIYWDEKEGGQPFYKFRGPCFHKLYKDGDSWTEELGFSFKEFDSALKKIGTKITKGSSKTAAFQKEAVTGLVIYWTDAGRVTWYHLNRNLLDKLLKGIYLIDNQREVTLDTPPKGNYLPSKNTKNTSNMDAENLFNELINLQNLSPNLIDDSSLEEEMKLLVIDLLKMGEESGAIKAFGEWWYREDWRGTKGQKPTIKQIRLCWNDSKANGNTPHKKVTVIE